MFDSLAGKIFIQQCAVDGSDYGRHHRSKTERAPIPSHDLRSIKRIGDRRQLIRWMKTSPRFTSITDLNTCLEATAYLLAFSSKAAIFHRDHAVDAMLKKEKRVERNTPFDPLHSHGAPGRIRTVDTRFRRVFFCENARKFWFYSDALPAVFRHYCHLRSSQTSFLVLLLFYKPSVKQGAERWLTIAKELFARI